MHVCVHVCMYVCWLLLWRILPCVCVSVRVMCSCFCVLSTLPPMWNHLFDLAGGVLDKLYSLNAAPSVRGSRSKICRLTMRCTYEYSILHEHVYLYVYVCVYMYTYCRLQNNWESSNGFQRFSSSKLVTKSVEIRWSIPIYSHFHNDRLFFPTKKKLELQFWTQNAPVRSLFSAFRIDTRFFLM